MQRSQKAKTQRKERKDLFKNHDHDKEIIYMYFEKQESLYL